MEAISKQPQKERLPYKLVDLIDKPNSRDNLDQCSEIALIT